MFKKSALHNLSHRKTLSMNMGKLVPVALFDVVPGDKIDHKIAALIRMQPQLAPIMHTVDIDIHAYFCPDRLVWDNSEDFQTGGDDGMDTTVAPYMTAPPTTGYAIGSLADYFGLPTGVPDYRHSALPFRCYNLIRNYYYRDSQLQPEVTISKADGLDTTTSRELLAPCWKRDYFTTCRPEPQLGPEVSIPLAGDAPVVSTNANPVFKTLSGPAFTAGNAIFSTASSGKFTVNTPGTATNAAIAFDGVNTGLETDLSDVAAVDIRDLREASAVERFLEFNNIFGGRYLEQIMARFGVRVPDYRLQWPDYLGSASAKIQFSEVLQTAEGTDPVGQMLGHGISYGQSNRYKRRIQEHGWVMVLMMLRPKTQYIQGIHKMWNRPTKYDYLLPEFAKIGDVPVLKKEVYAASADPDEVFGFQQYGEEYRTIPSSVAGEFRTTLNYWHMARIFASEPSLNATFVEANPTTRIYPAPSASQLYVTVDHTILARRLLPKFSSPGALM